MDDTSQDLSSMAPAIGSSHSNLKVSFKFVVRSLLTACPKEEFFKAFSGFTVAEQERLYGLFIQVISSLHGNIEAGMILDTVDQLVEEQSVDPLYSDKMNVENIKHEVSSARENEAELLKSRIAKAEDQKLRTEARIKLLKKIEISSNAVGAFEKLKSDAVKYGAYTRNG